MSSPVQYKAFTAPDIWQLETRLNNWLETLFEDPTLLFDIRETRLTYGVGYDALVLYDSQRITPEVSNETNS